MSYSYFVIYTSDCDHELPKISEKQSERGHQPERVREKDRWFEIILQPPATFYSYVDDSRWLEYFVF